MHDREWNQWLNEVVTWNVLEDLPRRKAILRFCKYGLIPFIESHGYAIKISLHLLCSRIATGLYENKGKSSIDSNWNFTKFHEEIPEYKYHFYDTIDTYRWNSFWASWGKWCDVEQDKLYAADRRYDIQEFIWTQISQEESYQTKIVNEFLHSDDEQHASEYDNKDAYLKDLVESNEWGGIRKYT